MKMAFVRTAKKTFVTTKGVTFYKKSKYYPMLSTVTTITEIHHCNTLHITQKKNLSNSKASNTILLLK